MCGIVGFLGGTFKQQSPHHYIEKMTRKLGHRGPDDTGQWVDPAYPVALGHTRLAILDLSAAGHQPMFSSTGRFAITYNGEIYNFQDLRRELLKKGCQFRGRSDTEILLESIEESGIDATLSRLTGMFAAAVWDREKEMLYLFRDRMGEKPLYYGHLGQCFVFASELKALQEHPFWDPCINREALAHFLRLGYVPTPCSIYEDVYKLEPGALLEVNGQGFEHLKTSNYWDVNQALPQVDAHHPTKTDQCYQDELHTLLTDIISQQQVADVPVGAYLSGGVDSSLITALMQSISSQPVRTFTIGFDDPSYNEAHHAREIAHHLGTAHTELIVTSKETLNLIPSLPNIFDEPFGDPAQIPTFLISQLAREHVSVALSGDGGDELFGGYNRHQLAQQRWLALFRAPYSLRQFLARLAFCLKEDQWEGVSRLLHRIFGSSMVPPQLGEKMQKIAVILSTRKVEDVPLMLISQWMFSENVVNGLEATLRPPQYDKALSQPNLLRQIMALDILSYLPDNNLAKSDRAGMAASLETRLPLVDYRLVEYAAKLPHSQKFRQNQGKWLLRQILYRHVPRKLLDRPKMGFGVPIGQWIRGDLREWADDLLSPEALDQSGLLKAEPIVKAYQEHLRGKRNWQKLLWNILVFQNWLQFQSASISAK